MAVIVISVLLSHHFHHRWLFFTASLLLQGEWYQGRRHGTGTIFLPNGDAFTGASAMRVSLLLSHPALLSVCMPRLARF